MYYMKEVKNRSVRLDDENFEWLGKLPGRTLNDAVTGLREERLASAPAEDHLGSALRDIGRGVGEILELLRGHAAPTAVSAACEPLPQSSYRGSLESLAPGPNLLPCRHCGLDAQIHPRAGAWRACSNCQRDGHFNISECRRCGEIAEAKRKAASSSAADTSDIDFEFQEPA